MTGSKSAEHKKPLHPMGTKRFLAFCAFLCQRTGAQGPALPAAGYGEDRVLLTAPADVQKVAGCGRHYKRGT